MNILIVTEVFYPENFHVNDFAQTMVAKGHHVKVMTRQPSYPFGYVYPEYKNEKYSVEKWGEIEIHRFDIIEGYKESKVKKVWNYYHYVKRGEDVIKKLVEGVDLIIVYHTGPLSLALPAMPKRNLEFLSSYGVLIFGLIRFICMDSRVYSQ